VTEVAAPVDEAPEPDVVPPPSQPSEDAREPARPESPGGPGGRERVENREHPAKGEEPQRREESSGDPEPPADEADEPQTDLEWLFERNQNVPAGWAFDPADEASSKESRASEAGSGSTSTVAETPAWRDQGRTGRSPWMVVVVFFGILLLLMLVSYIGGMAFSTIVNR
jgi:hypothetical protein